MTYVNGVRAWHILHAISSGDTLQVLTDGVVAWEGTLDRSAFAFDGPVGLRTDNGRFEVELFAALPPGPRAPLPDYVSVPSRCRRSSGD